MNALIIIALSSNSFASTPVEMGPYSVTLPNNFHISGRVAVDQDSQVDGTQVDIWISPGPGAARVNFWTADFNDNSGNAMPRTVLGRSNGSDNGWIESSSIECGKVVAYGTDLAGNRVMWTPRFNGGAFKQLSMYIDGVDTDRDNLSDVTEVSATCSSPTLFDTDGGGVDDGAEWNNGTSLVSAADDFDHDMDGVDGSMDPDDSDPSIYYYPDTYVGNMEFTGATAQDEMAAFCAGYEKGGRMVDGFVWIHDTDMANLSELYCLAGVTGQLAIASNPAMGTLAGLEELTSVGGTMSVHDMGSLQTVEGLSALTVVGGSFEISNAPLLTDLMDMGPVSTIGGDLYISNNTALSSLKGLETIQSTTGSVILTSNPALQDLSALGSISTIQGSLIIYDNISLPTLSDLSQIIDIGEALWVDGSPAMADLSGLENVLHLGSLTISNMDGLQSMTGLDNLKKVISTLRSLTTPA